MPLVDIHVIKGVFTPEQKSAMIAKVTDAMVSVEGEKLRGVTWVKINEVEGGDWAIGGQPLQAADVRNLAGHASETSLARALNSEPLLGRRAARTGSDSGSAHWG